MFRPADAPAAYGNDDWGVEFAKERRFQDVLEDLVGMLGWGELHHRRVVRRFDVAEMHRNGELL